MGKCFHFQYELGNGPGPLVGLSFHSIKYVIKCIFAGKAKCSASPAMTKTKSSTFKMFSRQWVQGFRFCSTFLHVARVRKHTGMWELHAFQFSHVWNACNSRMPVCFLTRATCKKVWHKSYTFGHCLMFRGMGRQLTLRKRERHYNEHEQQTKITMNNYFNK